MNFRSFGLNSATLRGRLMSSAVIPAVIGAGFAMGGGLAMAGTDRAAPAADRLLPMAQPRPAELAMLLQCRPCNPCAAKKGCNPCKAKGCNPCAAKGCKPCAAGHGHGCNPCAAKKKGCGPNGAWQMAMLQCRPCNPCAAKKGCNPCAAKNPCAGMRGCNPCNPCAAGGCNPCNPCNPCAGGGGPVSMACYVPRLRTAWACNPCAAKNPCAGMRGCGGCNPCAAKKGGCNPCAAMNPCAAKKGCNPCAAKNPCGAMGGCNPCNPCNPCGAGPAVDITAEEAAEVYACVKSELAAAYAKSGVQGIDGYQNWPVFNTVAYQSATHGGRYVNNYSNRVGAAAYGKFEDVGKVPRGTVLVKDSFGVNPDGSVALGPVFVMEKMAAGFNAGADDWRYTLAMPNGMVVGTTGGAGSANVQFCVDCHVPLKDMQDSLYFLPDDVRKN